MKTRYLGIIFVLAVIVPSILLAVLSIRAAGREEAFVEKQLTTTLLAEVTQTAGLANAEVVRIVDELRSGIDVPDAGDYARILPRWQRAMPLVGEPFLLSPRYGILWPREGPSLGDAQKRFLRQNGDFLSDKAATTLLQNIAVRYREEILAETRKAKGSSAAPVDNASAGGAGENAAPEQLQSPMMDRAETGAGTGSAGAASTDTAGRAAENEAAADAASKQQALDAFAQNPALQSRVYEQAREKGDQVSPRVAQPLSKAAQNAAPNVSRAPAAEQPPAPTEAPSMAQRPAPAAPGTTLAGAPVSQKDQKSAEASPAPAAVAASTGEQQSQFVITSRLLSQIASQGDYGLIPRFTGDALTFLFWERQKDGRIAGCEVAGAVLRQRIAAVLTGTYTTVRIITILDENGAPLATPPDAAARNWRQPFVSREIGESLPRWEVAGYLTSPDAISARARSSSLIVWILVLILFVSVAGGGTMVLNAVYGEMRLAQNKATFVTNVSHELKTPLTSLSLFVELLQQKRQPDAAKREKYLSLMASETERLTRLINNVLDFSGSERGTRKYAKRVVDAARVTAEIVESQRVGLESRGFALTMTTGPAGTLVRADPEALKQIILNLLSNAEKYSPGRKEIEVEVARARDTAVHVHKTAARARGAAAHPRPAASGAVSVAADFVHLHVRDRGVGVAEKDRERIFREFFRVDDSLSSRVRGTGLGLTIARRIARDHGGDVSCMPREGGGSDFMVRLPAAGDGEREDDS